MTAIVEALIQAGADIDKADNSGAHSSDWLARRVMLLSWRPSSRQGLISTRLTTMVTQL
jgi:hypothetical protein